MGLGAARTLTRTLDRELDQRAAGRWGSPFWVPRRWIPCAIDSSIAQAGPGDEGGGDRAGPAGRLGPRC